MKLIDKCKTLQDFRDLVAIRKNWVDFKDFTDTYEIMREGTRFILNMSDAASELYAKYKVKEAIKEYKRSQRSKHKPA